MNFRDNQPIYLQIAEKICDDILAGIYPPDQRLPSVREYGVKALVNSNTVMRTYDYLQSQGIIFNRRGIGYYVSPDAVDRVLDIRRNVFMKDELPYLFSRIKSLGITAPQLSKLYDDYLMSCDGSKSPKDMID